MGRDMARLRDIHLAIAEGADMIPRPRTKGQAARWTLYAVLAFWLAVAAIWRRFL